MTVLRLRRTRHDVPAQPQAAPRYPGLTIFVVFIPVVFLLLFVFVFGGALGAGLVPGGGQEDYLEFVVPGILLVTIAGGGAAPPSESRWTCTRGSSRGSARCRSRAARCWPVTSGAASSRLVALTLVLGIAVLIGFRPTPARSTGCCCRRLVAHHVRAGLAGGRHGNAGQVGRDREQPAAAVPAAAVPRRGFVPTDSMPEWLQVFAEWQPFTPFIETVRGLLLGTEIGRTTDGSSLVWCVAIGVGGYLWAKKLYERDPAAR